jgi:hypothetical protein
MERKAGATPLFFDRIYIFLLGLHTATIALLFNKISLE